MSGSLFDQLKKYDTAVPVAPAPPVDSAPEYIAIIKQTKNGQRIMISTIEPAPQNVIDDAINKHLPLFVPSEINKLAGADPEAVNAAIMTKLTMPGSTIIAHKEDPDA